jgi:NNP family nitrate/nitrite transporter-like MFS transporter
VHRIGLAVDGPNTPYWVFIVLAFTAGFGGGDFSSYMPSTSVFFPNDCRARARHSSGSAISGLVDAVSDAVHHHFRDGRQLADFNQGQPADEEVVGTVSVWLQNAAFIYVPFLLLFAGLAWYMLAACRSRRASRTARHLQR